MLLLSRTRSVFSRGGSVAASFHLRVVAVHYSDDLRLRAERCFEADEDQQGVETLLCGLDLRCKGRFLIFV
jgi:hypothetical protein